MCLGKPRPFSPPRRGRSYSVYSPSSPQRRRWRQTPDVDGEVDAGQRLVKIVDVEQDVVFRRAECAKVHQMTVAAGLNGRARDWLVREVGRHERRRPAQKRKGILPHPPISFGQQLGQAVLVALGDDRDSVPLRWTAKIRVEFPRRSGPQRLAQFESLRPAQLGIAHG